MRWIGQHETAAGGVGVNGARKATEQQEEQREQESTHSLTHCCA